jgi:peptide/nickel transport system substrate-binding protein
MTHPWPDYPIYASTNHTKILDPKQVEQAGKNFGFSVLPLGTGPFVFQKWTKDQEAVLVKNPNYWQKDLPCLSQITYKTIPDSRVASLSLSSGKVDVLQDPPVDQVPQFASNKAFTMIDHSGGGQYVINLNSTKSPFNDERVRQAVEFGINSQQITQSVFHGTAEVPHGFFPKSFWAHDSTFSVPYDPNKAKDLLAAAGYTSGHPLTFSLWVYNTPPYTDVGQLIQAQLLQIGVTVNVQALDYQTVVSGLRPTSAQFKQMDAAMYRHIARSSAWEFTGNRLAADGKLNYTLYNQPGGIQDPQVQQLFSQLEFLRSFNPADQEKIKAICAQIEKLVYLQDVPEIIVVHPNNLNIVSSRVHDYPNGAYDWAPLYRVWVSK